MTIRVKWVGRYPRKHSNAYPRIVIQVIPFACVSWVIFVVAPIACLLFFIWWIPTMLCDCSYIIFDEIYQCCSISYDVFPARAYARWCVTLLNRLTGTLTLRQKSGRMRICVQFVVVCIDAFLFIKHTCEPTYLDVSCLHFLPQITHTTRVNRAHSFVPHTHSF